MLKKRLFGGISHDANMRGFASSRSVATLVGYQAHLENERDEHEA
jgi:hypothetical protein